MDNALQLWIERFHQSACRCVFALTGGGSLAAAQLLQVPGGSRTLLEIVIPYHDQATSEFLGHRPDRFCSLESSQALALRSYERGHWLTPGDEILGLGCCASLVSASPKRGEHRAHVSTVHRERLRSWSLTLTKGARHRPGEEAVIAALVLHALANTLDLPPSPPLPLIEDEAIEESTFPLNPLALFFLGDQPLLVEPDGRMKIGAATELIRPSILMPGAFNPIHPGHWGLAQIGEEILGRPVAFELSVANVDKPELSSEEVRSRLNQFAGSSVWLTHAAKFVQKAKLFPGAVFLIGADTAIRIVSSRYYDNDPARMLGALELLREAGCRFLVACRAEPDGRCLQLEHVAIPADYRQLFTEIPASRFRFDLSSTELRARGVGI